VSNVFIQVSEIVTGPPAMARGNCDPQTAEQSFSHAPLRHEAARSCRTVPVIY